MIRLPSFLLDFIHKVLIYGYNILQIKSLIKKLEKDKWLYDKKSFASLGDNCNIQQPYHLINPMYISIGDNFTSLFNLRLEAYDKYEKQIFKPELKIGNNVKLGSDCHIGCINKVIIKDNVLIASKVYISDHSHGEINVKALEIIPLKRDLFSLGPVIIEECVWIGEAVTIMPGVTIGKNSIIGANAVITKNIPANSVAAGVPAKVLRTLV